MSDDNVFGDEWLAVADELLEWTSVSWGGAAVRGPSPLTASNSSFAAMCQSIEIMRMRNQQGIPAAILFAPQQTLGPMSLYGLQVDSVPFECQPIRFTPYMDFGVMPLKNHWGVFFNSAGDSPVANRVVWKDAEPSEPVSAIAWVVVSAVLAMIVLLLGQAVQ